MKQKKTLTHEQFVTIWQKAKTFQDAVAAIGGKAATISAKAAFLRMKGVPLKRFAPSGAPAWNRLGSTTVARLAEMAKSLARGE